MTNDIDFRNDILSLIIILGIIQGIFLAFFFLWKKQKNQLSNKYLGVILFLFALHNLDFWASYSRHILEMPFLLDISVPFTFLMGPLLYHYIYISLKNKPDKYLIWHYIPFVFFFLYSLFFIFQPSDFKYNVFVSSRNIDRPLREIVLHHSFDPFGIRKWTGLFISVQLCIYLFLSFLLFFKHLKDSNMNFFKPADPVVLWLRNLLFATTLIVITAVIIQLFYPGGRAEFVLACSFTLFIYYLSFNLIRGSGFLNQTLFHEKYVKSSLKDEMKGEYSKRLEELMNNEKPYTDNLFSLHKLARQTRIPANQLSQVLNESFHQSFFEFTRTFRIKEAQQLLSDPKYAQTNIEEIAFMVGYNSKAAFNKAFLNITGQTPLSYKKKNLK